MDINKCKIVAPATGTPETGGWSTRELRTILRGLDGVNFIGADIVEVAPAYDTNAEHTTMYVVSPFRLLLLLFLPIGSQNVSFPYCIHGSALSFCLLANHE